MVNNDIVINNYLNIALWQGRESTLLVRTKGLEPPRLTAPDPKSGAATNYATSAFLALQI
jgi:hypothetical protein